MNVKLLIENLNALDKQCNEILASNTPILQNLNKIQILLENHYSEAKEKFIKFTFESINHHIDYFKLYHSKMIGLCLHYKTIQYIEHRLLSKSLKSQLKILKDEIENLDLISRDHPEFIIYITAQSSHFDKEYFTLDDKNKSYSLFSSLDRDPTFSTHHSFLLGKILSGNRTLKYIDRKLDNLKNRSTQSSSPLLRLKWNGKKVDFVEAIRAFHAEGAFSEDISHVFKVLEQVIITGPLDHYSIYKDIKRRSNEKTKYLSKAAEALQNTIDKELD